MGNTYKKKKEFDIKPLKKNTHLRLKVTVSLMAVAFVFSFFGLFIFLVNEYINTHTFTWQSPVIVRTPVVIKSELQIISPLSTRSGYLNNKAYASEVKNPFDERSPRGIAWELVKDKWGIQEWTAFELVANKESGFNPYSVNSSSGACGIPQALPCSKMDAEDWDYESQLKWMVNYIDNRYGTPTKAWEFHQTNNWY